MADHLVGGLHCAEASDLAASFVLGALEAAEVDAVRQHLAGCPEAHAEFAELGSVVPALFDMVDIVEPPAGLGARIRAAAAAELSSTVAPSALPESGRLGESVRWREGDTGTATRRGPSRRPVWVAIGLAAALALVALGAWNLQLRDQVEGLTAYRNGVAAVLDQAAQPGARLAVLGVPEGAPGPNGLAAISSAGTQVALVMRDLAPTTGTEVYEAWIITGDKAPVPIGHFTVDSSGTTTFLTTAPSTGEVPAITVALTRERGPGATTPTLPIVALGTAASS